MFNALVLIPCELVLLVRILDYPFSCITSGVDLKLQLSSVATTMLLMSVGYLFAHLCLPTLLPSVPVLSSFPKIPPYYMVLLRQGYARIV